MKFVVIGLGLFGKRVTLELAAQGHEVLAIDNDESHIQEVYELVTRAVVGDATNEGLIKELVTPDIDAAVVAIGSSVEASLLSVLHLQSVGVKNIYAKSNQAGHTTILQRLGISAVIRPEEDSAERLSERLGRPHVRDHVKIREDCSLLELEVPSEFEGKKLVDLKLRRNYRINVIGVLESTEEKMNFVPSPQYKFKKNDVMLLVASAEKLEEFMALYGG
ncbi:MAG: potassium channel family protein [bacterium]